MQCRLSLYILVWCRSLVCFPTSLALLHSDSYVFLRSGLLFLPSSLASPFSYTCFLVLIVVSASTTSLELLDFWSSQPGYWHVALLRSLASTSPYQALPGFVYTSAQLASTYLASWLNGPLWSQPFQQVGLGFHYSSSLVCTPWLPDPLLPMFPVLVSILLLLSAQTGHGQVRCGGFKAWR